MKVIATIVRIGGRTISIRGGEVARAAVIAPFLPEEDLPRIDRYREIRLATETYQQAARSLRGIKLGSEPMA